MLIASGGDQQVDIAWVAEQRRRARPVHPLPRRPRPRGRDRGLRRYLDDTKFSVDQVRFVNLIVDELTANGVMEPARLYESPYTDHGHVDLIFPDDVEVIVDILRDVNATPSRAEPLNGRRCGDHGSSPVWWGPVAVVCRGPCRRTTDDEVQQVLRDLAVAGAEVPIPRSHRRRIGWQIVVNWPASPACSGWCECVRRDPRVGRRAHRHGCRPPRAGSALLRRRSLRRR